MTTTSTMQGLGSEERPTSRVLQPPGGGGSDIFGTSSDTTPTSQPQRHQNQRSDSNIFGGPEPTKAATPKSSLFTSAEEHKIYGKGRNQSKFNPITGEPYDENGSPCAEAQVTPPPPQPRQQQQQQQQADNPIVGDAAGDQAATGKARPNVHTSSRVSNPPGGKSSGPLW